MWSTDEDSELEEELNKRNDNRLDWYQDLQSKFNNSSSEEDDYNEETKTKIQEADMIIKGTPDEDFKVKKTEGTINEMNQDNSTYVAPNLAINQTHSSFTSQVNTDKNAPASERRPSQVSANELSQGGTNTTKCCTKAVVEFDPRLGPFDVFISKMHKPAFICFVDLIMAATFFIGSSCFFLIKMDDNVQTTANLWQILDVFLPDGMFFLQIMCFLKFTMDKMFLSKQICTSQKMRNRSITLIRLFRMRLIFDGIVLIAYFKFFMGKDQKNKFNTLNFRTFYVLCPILLIEFLIYTYSVSPAYNRHAYQKTSFLRFKENKLVWLKGRADPTKHQKNIDKFVEKIQKTVDNNDKLIEISKLNSNEYFTLSSKKKSPFLTLKDQVEDRRQELFEQASFIMVPLIECSKNLACFITVLNVAVCPLGTLLAVFVDNRKTVNFKVLILFIIQAILYYIAWKLQKNTGTDQEEANDNSDIGMFLGNFVWIWAIIYGLILHQYNNILMGQLEQIYD